MKNELLLAKKEYINLPIEGKQLLERIFGKDAFKTDFRDIETFDDACKATGEDPDNSKYITGSSDNQAYEKLKTIIKAVNGGWTPNFANSNQYKWAPWFRYDPKISGFRFYGSGYDGVAAYSTGGSRLCLESEEKSDYVGKQFIELYNQFLN